jgi:hypothetical protein
VVSLYGECRLCSDAIPFTIKQPERK